jgi:hypothetical protein
MTAGVTHPLAGSAVAAANGLAGDDGVHLRPTSTEKSTRAAEKREKRQRRKLKIPIPIDTNSPLTLMNRGNPSLDFVKKRPSKKTYAEQRGPTKVVSLQKASQECRGYPTTEVVNADSVRTKEKAGYPEQATR